MEPSTHSLPRALGIPWLPEPGRCGREGMPGAGVMLSHPGDPLPSPPALPSLWHSRLIKGTLIKGNGCQGHARTCPTCPGAAAAPEALTALFPLPAPGVGLWHWGPAPPPKPCSESVSELLSLQPPLRAVLHSQLLLPFPAHCPGALPLCLNQGCNRSTPWLPKPSHLRCHQEIVLELRNIL